MMKYINNYIRLLAGTGLIILLLHSCYKFEDLDSKEATLSAPTVELTVVSVEDNSITVSASSNMDGYLAVAILAPDTSFSRERILTNNLPDADRFAYRAEEVEAGASVTLTFDALNSYSHYTAVAVANNAEGNTSNLVEIPLRTDNNVPPVLDTASTNPAISNAPAVPLDFKVTLVFSEGVQMSSLEGFRFKYLNIADFSTTTYVASDVTINGNVVTVSQSHVPENRQYVFLEIVGGSIEDYIGNNIERINSGLDLATSTLYGLFWRTEAKEINITEITPAEGEAQTEADFPIVLTADAEFSGFAATFNEDPLSDEGNVILTYITAGGVVMTFVVPGDNIEIEGSEVTIEQPYTPNPGDRIFLTVNAGAFRDLNGNVNAAYAMEIGGEDGWLISKGLELTDILASYEAHCISYFSGDEYIFDMTIEEDSEVEDGVIIRGFEGTDTAIHGVFDGILGTITIEAGQTFGDLLGDGSDVVIVSSEEGPVVAEVNMDGDITCSWGGLIVGGDNDGYYWDFYFNSSWIKQVGKKTSSHNNPVRSLESIRLHKR